MSSPPPGVCPTCGTCPTCGRKNHAPLMIPVSPWSPGFIWTASTTTGNVFLTDGATP